MANSAEMLRLMRHAADLLDACDPHINGGLVVRYAPLGVEGVGPQAVNRATAEGVAIGTASAILRMVAAAMEDEPQTEPKVLTYRADVLEEVLSER